MFNHYLFSVGVFACMFVIGLFSPVYAQSIVVPNQFTNQSGFGISSAFNCVSPNGVRTQTLFPGNQLTAGTIEAISTRLFPGSSGFSEVIIPDVTIKMSTTTVTEGNLNSFFADNVGKDETVVFQGDLSLAAPSCNTNPCPFADPLNLTRSFTFNPEEGNLLVEFVIPPCSNGVPIEVRSDVTSELETILVNNSNLPNGSDIGLGVITEFSFSAKRPIPSLSEWGLITMACILGIVGFIVVRRWNTATS